MLTTGKGKYFQLIPQKIIQNIEGIEENILPKIKGYSRENLYEVISIVASQTRKDNKPAQLQITYIKKLVPQGDRYLHELMNYNIIKRSGNAIKGTTSFQYSFSAEYFSKFISVSLDNQKLIHRIMKVHEEKNKAVSATKKGLTQQVKYLKLLTIDDSFNDFINTTYSNEIHTYNCVYASATRIVNKDFFYCVDSTGGRFHSNITNMSKELRPYLKIQDEPLVNIDIRNCQPFLSIVLLTNPVKVAFLAKNKAFSLLLQTLKVSQNEDVKKYIALVSEGVIYEYLTDEFLKVGIQLPDDYNERRDAVKKHVLRILFARNRMPKNEMKRKARQVFINSFPTVNQKFSEIRGYQKDDDRFSNYKRFAILLQSLESHLMLHVILKRVYQELPGTIAITIHDSIMTGISPKTIKNIEEIIIEEVEKFVGYKPQIKIEGKERGKIERKSNMLLQTL